MSSKKEENVDNPNACVVCFKGVEIYSIGQCDHPVCFECSTRMRVLCRQNECPICRQEMPKVFFTKNVRPFNTIKDDHKLTDFKFKICFESQEEASAFETLLAHECQKCKKTFSTFTQLKEHVRRTHFLNYCELCVKNLKILSRERRCYTRQELGTHRRIGDEDDRSHRGHPLCEFCDTRYMDNDELYRHLRRDHLYCHFCDADGLHQYYNTYDFLREHFRSEHFLCEEGDCYNEKFTAVFRTDIDLKAHKTTAHGKGLGKAGLKQARTLDIQFTLAPRPTRPPRRRQYREEDSEAGAVGGAVLEEQPVQQERSSVFAQINTDCIEEFPTLGGNPVPNVLNGQATTVGRSTASSVARRGCRIVHEDDFPALGPDTTQVSLKVNSERPSTTTKQPLTSNQASRPSSTTNVSIQVNHPRFTTTVTSHNTYNYHFPALDSGTSMPAPTTTTTSVHWTSKRIEKKPVLVNSNNVYQGTVTTAGASGHDPPPANLEAFPALTPTAKCQTSTKVNCQTQLNNTIASSTDSEQQTTTTVATTKVKKKKSKSRSTNSTTSIEVAVKSPETSKKKSNNIDGKNSGDVTLTPPTSSKKKAKENTIQSNKNHTETNGNVNNINNNNRKVLKTQKSENVKGKQENKSDKREEKIKIIQEKEKINSDLLNEKRKERTKTVSEKMPVEPEAFPALGSGAPPPGFEPKWQVKRPPPGLEKQSPSGLLLPVSSTPNAPPPGFNPINGFPPLGQDTDSTKAQYIAPPNFAKRNSALVTKMSSALGSESFELFKQMSFAFRSGNVPPLEYYSSCRNIMGPNTFLELFPELLALLPDIEKQQELWTVYKSEISKSPQPARTSKKKGTKSGSTSPLEACATCYQVVSSSDLRSHLTCHALDNHFPALDTQITYNNNNNAWSQHK